MGPQNASAVATSRDNARRRWLAFGLVSAVLLIAAIGLNATVGMLKVRFQKLPVPLRHPVAMLPSTLGGSASTGWVQLTLDRPLDGEVEHALGTKEYVFRFYADASEVPAGKIEDLLRETEADRRESMSYTLQREYPKGVVKFALTYYTGSVDTVPHIPERCMVAGGFDPVSPQTRTLGVLAADGSPRPIDVRYIDFQHERAGSDAPPMNVAYFFHVNGGFESDPITGVRLRLQDLRVRHGYFAKIELMTQDHDREAAAGTMTRFMNVALPEVEKVLPDWQTVEGNTEAVVTGRDGTSRESASQAPVS